MTSRKHIPKIDFVLQSLSSNVAAQLNAENDAVVREWIAQSRQQRQLNTDAVVELAVGFIALLFLKRNFSLLFVRDA
jgi:hypothetical protein